MSNNNSGSSNQLLVRGAEQALDQMKYEIAQEFGVQLMQMQQLVQTDLLVVKLQNVLYH